MKVVPLPTIETVTQTEAARRLGVCRRTIYNYIKDGLLTVTAKGRVTVRSINRFIQEETA